MKNLYTLFLIACLGLWQTSFSQGTCATAINIGTPTTTSSCQTWTTSSGTSGGTSCNGGGWGGNGFNVRYVQFCTDASNSCINFDFTSTGGYAGNVNFTLYTAGCASGVAVGAVQQCQTGLVAGGTIAFAPTNNSGVVVTTASTCYVLRMAFASAPSAANPIQMCAYTEAPAVNDVCAGSLPIDAVPAATNNDPACSFSGGPTANTPAITPGDLCAGSLENTAWYTFTVNAAGTVVITIDNIVCVGGGSGFQIGYFSGSCGSLTNLGCSSGSGGTVTATITGLTAGQVITIAIDGNAGAFCNFDISATNTIPLPIELTNFDAKEINGSVSLSWTTATEINNDYFTIEKTKDGEIFEVVGLIDGAGNSQMINSYFSKDDSPFKGTSYYRLSQTDYDGTTTQSNLVAVKIASSFGDLTVYPNPVEQTGYLSFNSSTLSNSVTVVIYDVSGRIISSNQFVAVKGANKFELNTNGLPQGMYFLTIEINNERENIKFIKD